MSKFPAKRRKPLFRKEVEKGSACSTPKLTGGIQKKRRRRLGWHSRPAVQPSPIPPSSVQPSPIPPSHVQPSPIPPSSVQPSPIPPSHVQPSPIPPSHVQPSPSPIPPSPVPPSSVIHPEDGRGGDCLPGPLVSPHVALWAGEEDLLTGICPEDFSFTLNTTLPPPSSPHTSLSPPPHSLPHTSLSPPPHTHPHTSLSPPHHSPHCLQIIPDNSRSQPVTVQNSALHSIPAMGDADVELGQSVIPDSPPPPAMSEVDGFFGLPLLVKSLLEEHRGIHKLYAWQEECLRLPHVLAGGNLLYCLPTSGGKTLVAEVLILRQLLLRQRDVLLVLPYVSIVQEKVRDLAPFASSLGFAVEEYAASRGRFPPIRRRRKRVVYMATIEKASGLVDSLAELSRLQTIGLVAVDELHMLGDGSVRGATLETCLTKILCLSRESQIIGMSATLSNTADIAAFLRAKTYTSEFRPVELREYVMLGSCVYSAEVTGGKVILQPQRDITAACEQGSHSSQTDSDLLVALVGEVLPQASCLVFCATKRQCQNAALLLARQLPRFHCDYHFVPREALLKSLAVEASGVCPVLARTVPVGVAYHHSGLTADERRLVEEGFSHGELNVLCCTSTLAAGVNLPAKRVILRSPYIGTCLLSHSQYKQMVGRAGRTGLAESGDSILITSQTDKHKVMQLLSSPYDRCNSSLLCDENTALTTFILSLVGLKLAKTTSDLQSFLRATLYYQQNANHTHFLSRCQETVTNLVAMGYITTETVNESCSDLIITLLGRATVKGCVSVQSAGKVYSELNHAQSSLVLSTNLHLLFLATPSDHTPPIRPNWLVFFQTLTGLTEDEMKVAELVGVSPSLLGKLATGTGANMSKDQCTRYTRFYLSLMLHRLISDTGSQRSGRGVWSVAEHFQCSRGFLQSTITAVSSFAASLVHFTQELPELWALHQLLPSVVKRLSNSACADLVSLMEIPGVRQGRARQLLQAGYPTPESLATVSPAVLCEKVAHLYPKQARRIVQAAKALLREKAEELFEEAENLVADLS